LEIIFSDDCSQDRTFEIIQEEVAKYDGPHRIVLNRNDSTLGHGRNQNRVAELAKGKLIVNSDGDDVSLPTRTEELVSVWLSGGVYCISSSMTIVDEDGRVIGEELAKPVGSWQEVVQRGPMESAAGAAAAWDRDVFDTFEPLPYHTTHEDCILELRAALLGKIGHVDKCLVKWRRHGTNISKNLNDLMQMDVPQLMDTYLTMSSHWTRVYQAMLQDIHLISSTRPEMETDLLQAARVIKARMELNGLLEESAVANNRVHRLRRCLRVIKNVKSLGIKPVIKACILSVSPTAYFIIQHRWWRWKFAR
jgi:glycosyltransferase involved in cell wall biosynthesis